MHQITISIIMLWRTLNSPENKFLLQEQSPRGVLQKVYSEKFRQTHWEAHAMEIVKLYVQIF